MGAATAITLEPLIDKAGWRLLSVLGFCLAAKQKLKQLEVRPHNLESRTVQINDEENESVHVLANSSLKLHPDSKRELNLTKHNFR